MLRSCLNMPFQKGHKIWLGRKHTEEAKEKTRQAKLGEKNPMFGTKLSAEAKAKITFHDEKHPGWKGDDVGYFGLHQWIRKNLAKPEFCQICGIKPPEQAACITGLYNREFKNWKWLCVSCHIIFDERWKKRSRDPRTGKFMPGGLAREDICYGLQRMLARA